MNTYTRHRSRHRKASYGFREDMRAAKVRRPQMLGNGVQALVHTFWLSQTLTLGDERKAGQSNLTQGIYLLWITFYKRA